MDREVFNFGILHAARSFRHEAEVLSNPANGDLSDQYIIDRLHYHAGVIANLAMELENDLANRNNPPPPDVIVQGSDGKRYRLVPSRAIADFGQAGAKRAYYAQLEEV